MATIQKRGNNYRIKVSCGYDTQGKQVIQSMTWKPDEKMTEKQIEKELQRQVVLLRKLALKATSQRLLNSKIFQSSGLRNMLRLSLSSVLLRDIIKWRNGFISQWTYPFGQTDPSAYSEIHTGTI